jgi:transaldolase
MTTLDGTSIKVFADGADAASMLELRRHPRVRGFTTNPTLMRQAGVTDYRTFARQVLDAIPDRPISFEVVSDEWDEMERQAVELASLGTNVYVKVPVTNTSGESSAKLLMRLAEQGVKLNVTALLSLRQVVEVVEALRGAPPSFVSVFAGRIADTGRDPRPLMAAALEVLRPHPHLELIWASPREVLNVLQAAEVGCHVITLTGDLLRKLDLLGRDLEDVSLDTVRMFQRDAEQAGYQL